MLEDTLITKCCAGKIESIEYVTALAIGVADVVLRVSYKKAKLSQGPGVLAQEASWWVQAPPLESVLGWFWLRPDSSGLCIFADKTIICKVSFNPDISSDAD